MKTYEISRILGKRDPCTKKAFLGVFPSDSLISPLGQNKRVYIVCNLDGVKFQGSHWVGIYLEKIGGGGGYKGEYYDSFGRRPDNVHIKKWLNYYCKTWTYNKTRVQNYLADTCGQHVIYYASKRCRGLTMDEITRLLKSSGNPDVEIFNYVKKMYS
jgi:hypothetical protein